MLQRIEQIQDRLSTAERRVGDWVLRHPDQVASRTLAEIAEAANVSEPTIVRFCRSIGASGFRDFKMRLVQHLAANEHVVHADVSPDDKAEEIIAKVIGRSVKELVGVQRHLNAQRVESVIDALANSSRIEFYGIGASGYVAHDAQNKFFRLGLPCTAYNDSATLVQAASITGPSHAVVIISKTGETKSTVDAAHLANRRGASVITITSPGSTLAMTSELSLLVDIDEDTGLFTPMSSRLAQLAVLDVLQVALALRLGDQVSVSLDRTKRALNRN